MSAEPKPDLPLEIAHLLLIDAVGYSKLLVNEQIELPQALNQIPPQHRMFPGGGSKWQTHSSINWRWDGARFLPQSGGTCAMCAGD